MTDPIKIFVSHAEIDSRAGKAIKSAFECILQDHCEVFFSPESLQPSDTWLEEIRQNALSSDILISVLTSNAISRPWIMAEAGIAWALGKMHIVFASEDILVSDIPDFISVKQTVFPTRDISFLRSICSKLQKEFKPLRLSLSDQELNEMGKEIATQMANLNSPAATIEAWNSALTEGNLELAQELTSKKSSEYIKKQFGSLEELSRKYQDASYASTKLVTLNVDLSTTRTEAVVKYIVFYEDISHSVKEWQDLLVYEDNRWKVAPQYVTTADITPDTRISSDAFEH